MPKTFSVYVQDSNSIHNWAQHHMSTRFRAKDGYKHWLHLNLGEKAIGNYVGPLGELAPYVVEITRTS